jgi:hypothetical protein
VLRRPSEPASLFVHRVPIHCLPHLTTVREFHALVHVVVNLFGNPRRVFVRQGREFCGVVRGSTNPHKVIRAAHAGSCNEQLARVDAYDVLRHVGLLLVLRLDGGRDDAVYGIVNLEGACDCARILVVTEVHRHDAVAIVGGDCSSLVPNDFCRRV